MFQERILIDIRIKEINQEVSRLGDLRTAPPEVLDRLQDEVKSLIRKIGFSHDNFIQEMAKINEKWNNTP